MNLNDRRGSIGIWLLCLLLGILSLTPIILSYVGHVGKSARYELRGLQAGYAAESGLNWCLAYCRKKDYADLIKSRKIPFRVNDGIQVEVCVYSRENNRIEIVSIARYDREYTERRLKVTVHPGEDVNELSIEEVY